MQKIRKRTTEERMEKHYAALCLCLNELDKSCVQLEAARDNLVALLPAVERKLQETRALQEQVRTLQGQVHARMAHAGH